MLFEKVILIAKLSNAMTIDVENRKSQLSPLKYDRLKGLMAYYLMVLLNIKSILQLKKENREQLRYLFDNHAEALPSVFWPYQCSGWNLIKRLDALVNHFETISQINNYYISGIEKPRNLLDLDDVFSGMKIIMDRNCIFMREGMAVFNLFIDEERVFSLAFSLMKNETDKIVAVIGAIQGRRMSNITELYRDITKSTYGIRPRDFIIELFQIVCKAINVDKIYAVRDSKRQHRHIFYRVKSKEDLLSLDYDEVWSDRGGECCKNGFYILPVQPERRKLHNIISKKRSMYRNRYDMLDHIENQLIQILSVRDVAMDQYQDSNSQAINGAMSIEY